MSKVNEVSAEEISEVLAKKDSSKAKKTILWILAIIGTIAAIAGIAYAVYRWLTPNYLEDFEEEFEDDYWSWRMVQR